MMDWVHCNNCFILPGMGKRFFLTSCGHIYCANCITECATDHCKLCGNTCSTISLSSQVKPDVEMYFADPLELLKKYLKEIQKVSEFQSSHRTRLCAYQRDMLKKTQLLKDEFKKIQAKFKESECEKQRLENQVECMKQMLNMSQFQSTKIETSEKTGSFAETPRKNVDPFRDTTNTPTPMSKWSHASSSHSRNWSVGSVGSSTKSVYPAMPSRVTIRTPPVNGKIGVVPVAPSNSSGINLQNLRLSSDRNDPDATPKAYKRAYVSPMSISPCSSTASVVSHDFPRVTSSYGSLSQHSHQSSRLDVNSIPGSHGSSARPIRIKLPHEMKNYGSIKTLAVSPYSPQTKKM